MAPFPGSQTPRAPFAAVTDCTPGSACVEPPAPLVRSSAGRREQWSVALRLDAGGVFGYLRVPMEPRRNALGLIALALVALVPRPCPAAPEGVDTLVEKVARAYGGKEGARQGALLSG